MLLAKAADALKHCGNEIAGIIGEAASRGEFELVVRLGSLAAQISSLADGLITTQVPATFAGPNTKVTVGVKKPKTAASQYPKFARFDDQLVKIGWSKKDKTEYIHKAPQDVLGEVCDRLEVLGKKKSHFETEKLLRTSDGSAARSQEVPLYQIYLCLAWLRSLSLVEQNGRNSYTVRSPQQLKGAVQSAWDALPPRNL